MFTSCCKLQNMLLISFIALGCACQMSLALVDYCDVDRRNSSISSPGIQFTKELSSQEYGVLSSFKSLHCCSKGYRSIEWFKDGKAYPWAGDVSSFILYPESANQTIYSQALGAVDSGNYTCIVANDSQTVSHTVTLTVFDTKKNYMDIPLETYILPPEQFLRVGKTARLYCEAFVGKIDLPDAESQVWWERTGFNMSSPEAQRYQQQPAYREEGQVLGAYLIIERLRRSDLGEYVCSISNTEDQVLRQATVLREEEWQMDVTSHKIPWLKLQFIILVVLILATLAIVYNRFALSALLYLKLKFCPRPLNDGKEHDVLVCYSTPDSDFAVAVLARTLQSRYNYTVSLCQLNTARVSAELQLASTSSRCVLAVLSPSLFSNQWTPAAISPFLKQLVDTHPTTIFVSQKALDTGDLWKSDEGAALRQLLSQTTFLEWRDSTPTQRRHFWTRLRLSLPPPLPATGVSSSQPPEDNSASTTTKAKLSTFAKSSESLEVLV